MWPYAMAVGLVLALQVFPAKETGANLVSRGTQGQDGFTQDHSLTFLRHKFSGHMKVACQDQLAETPLVTVSGEIKDGRVSGIFIIDTHGWIPTSVFDIGLSAFDQVHSKFNTQVFSASVMDRRFARLAWLDGEVDLERIRLTTGFRFLDTSIKNINGKIELPDDLKIAYCMASNSFTLTPL